MVLRALVYCLLTFLIHLMTLGVCVIIGTPIGDIFSVSKPKKILHSKLMLPRPRKDVLVSQKKDATVSQIMGKLKFPRVEEDEQKCAPSKKNSPPNLREIMERQEVQEKLLKDIESKVNDQSLLLGKAMKDLKADRKSVV